MFRAHEQTLVYRPPQISAYNKSMKLQFAPVFALALDYAGISQGVTPAPMRRVQAPQPQLGWQEAPQFSMTG
jgi:hypothetical protein